MTAACHAQVNLIDAQVVEVVQLDAKIFTCLNLETVEVSRARPGELRRMRYPGRQLRNCQVHGQCALIVQLAFFEQSPFVIHRHHQVQFASLNLTGAEGCAQCVRVSPTRRQHHACGLAVQSNIPRIQIRVGRKIQGIHPCFPLQGRLPSVLHRVNNV